MDPRDIAQQTLLEQRILSHITQATRTTIAWKLHGKDNSRKLATLRFVTASLKRHLDHLMALEECDGYMAAALESCPNMSEKIDSLKREHALFREAFFQLAPRLEGLAADDATGLETVCVEIGDLLARLDEHTRKEEDLLQEALLRDEGGEG
ncbi:MAG: hemerythrin domain-containing protein [Planctomycetia bacterium]|nr:hemerythrin domain-containing protein [Planctomycetia bacterium]